MVARILNWVGNIWLILGCLIILAGYASVLIFRGWDAFTDMLSPFNITHWVTVMLILAPGIGLKLLSKKLMRGKNEA